MGSSLSVDAGRSGVLETEASGCEAYKQVRRIGRRDAQSLFGGTGF